MARRRLGRDPYDGRALYTTPIVTAPEVWERQPVQPTGDLYSFAVVLYAALTGRYPFQARSHEGFRDLHREATPPDPTRIAPVGPATAEGLLRTLAEDPAARFGCAAELTSALRGAVVSDGVCHREESAPAQRPASWPTTDDGEVSKEPTIDEDTVLAAGVELERFASTLDGREQGALYALFAAVRVAGARAAAEVAGVTMQLFGPGAALLALDDTGAAAALAAGSATSAGISAARGAPVQTIGRVLDVLAAMGLARRDGDTFALAPAFATIYGDTRQLSSPCAGGGSVLGAFVPLGANGRALSPDGPAGRRDIRRRHRHAAGAAPGCGAGARCGTALGRSGAGRRSRARRRGGLSRVGTGAGCVRSRRGGDGTRPGARARHGNQLCRSGRVTPATAHAHRRLAGRVARGRRVRRSGDGKHLPSSSTASLDRSEEVRDTSRSRPVRREGPDGRSAWA